MGSLLKYLTHRPAWISLVLLALLPLSSGGAQDRPRAVFAETSHDFGEFIQDREQKHDFVVQNSGTAPLKILEVDPDCACTVPSYDREIPPGGKGRITLALKPYSVLREFQKKTRIRTNDPDTPQVVLVLTGVSKPVLEILPGHIIRFKGPLTQVHEARVRLLSHGETPLEIREVRNSLPDKVQVTVAPKTAGKEFLLTVKNLAREPGHYAGRIELITNYEKRPRLLLRVFADLTPAGEKP
jgi:hypothetical protein